MKLKNCFDSYDHMYKTIHKLELSSIISAKPVKYQDVVLLNAIACYTPSCLNLAVNEFIDMHIDKKGSENRVFHKIAPISVAKFTPPTIDVASISAVVPKKKGASKEDAPQIVTNDVNSQNTKKKNNKKKEPLQVQNTKKDVKKRGKQQHCDDSNTDDSKTIVFKKEKREPKKRGKQQNSDESNTDDSKASAARNQKLSKSSQSSRRKVLRLSTEEASVVAPQKPSKPTEDNNFKHILEFIQVIDDEMTYTGMYMFIGVCINLFCIVNE